jgi:hypothetical protein
MALKLAIADVIGVKVEGKTTQDDGSTKDFKFVLVCDRLPHDQVKQHLDDKEGTTTDFFLKHAKGWKDQKLVLDGDGNPAAFSEEALNVLFTIAGMANTCWQAYLAQVVVTAKN